MADQMTFRRYEMKYLLRARQMEQVLAAMRGHMEADEYGLTTIRNIYFDTDSYLLIRRSLEKPRYKEKLRVRSYRRAGCRDKVFVEIKKKYGSVVYKRRLAAEDKLTRKTLGHGRPLPLHSQIADEINYFCSYYKTLRPAIFLSYDRIAYRATDGSDFRVTFDRNICFRETELSLGADTYGTPLLDEGETLMEIKTAGAGICIADKSRILCGNFRCI